MDFILHGTSNFFFDGNRLAQEINSKRYDPVIQVTITITARVTNYISKLFKISIYIFL
jgi:hypothetical protein